MRYTTNCTSSDATSINNMKRRAQEVTYRTFRRHCGNLDEVAQQMGYALHPARGLMLVNDWHVRYYKSSYRGKPCYYMAHSAIEYIWT